MFSDQNFACISPLSDEGYMPCPSHPPLSDHPNNMWRSAQISKNIKLIIKNYNFACVLYGCETWSLTLREEHRLRGFENIWTE
jgi:hypothetical protein